MLLNEDIVDIEKHDGIRSLTFVVDEFSGLFLHPSIFSIIHSRSTQIINGALCNFWYWLTANILGSSEEIITFKKSLFSYTVLWNSGLFFVLK